MPISNWWCAKHSGRISLSINNDTKRNTNSIDEADGGIDSDAAYLLDMDLSILGMTWPEYKYYAQAVRQEYAHVATAAYQMGRIAVLESLLAHPRLYRLS